MRGAILAIPQGQIEAARAYGMSPGLMLRRITLPAMLPFAIPGLANLWLIATKDTALLAVVGFNELTQETRTGRRHDQGLFHLLHRGRRALSAADAVLQCHHRAHRALVAARHAVAGRRTDGRRDLVNDRRAASASLLAAAAPHRADRCRHCAGRLRRRCSCAGTGCPTISGWRSPGLWRTIWILAVTTALGFLLAVPLGLVQVTGPRWLSWPAYWLLHGHPRHAAAAAALAALLRARLAVPAISMDPRFLPVAVSQAGLALCRAVADLLLRRL